MKAGRVVVIVLALGAVAAAAVFALGGGGGDGGGDGGSGKPASGAVRITFAYSPEKAALIRSLVDEFNRAGQESGGRPVFVTARPSASGEAELRIARGRLKPVVWSPASSLWGRLLNFDADRPYVADDNPSLVRTPLVIAMWEPLARALGWPRQRVGYDQILRLATSKRGWAAYGKPEFGRFKLGHTNPDFSTSGLSAVVAEYYAASGKREGLTVADVDRPKVRREIKAIERSIVHYGDTTLFFAEQLKRYGPGYASAVAMEEATLVDFNRGRSGASRLVALYPREGTFESDNPFLVLDAPWVDERERAAAAVFGKWLRGKLTPEVAGRGGFRPPDPDARPVAPVDASRGADPAQPRTVLGLPEPQVLDRIKRAWRQDRKPANIMLVVDTSGSMSEENKLERAKTGLQGFLRELQPTDRVGLTAFNSDVFPLAPIRPFGAGRAPLQAKLRDLFPDGETAVYDATQRGLRDVQRVADDDHINAVVVLTDGEDNQSAQSAQGLARELDAQARAEGRNVRVYTIAYGSQANDRALRLLAQASGGKGFEGDTGDIAGVYRQISSFF